MEFIKAIRQKSDVLLIILTGIVLLWVNLNINSKKDYSKGLIESDARGYYAYLPAIFIYHDLNLGFFDTIEKSKYYNPNLYYEFRTTHNGKTIDKYYIGTAICLSPFFMAGHLLTKINGYPQDGYSLYYVKSVSIAVVFYLLISLLLLNKLLKRLEIDKSSRTLALFAMVFGTNLFYYSVVESCLSHVYSLAFISLFIYVAHGFFQKPNIKDLILAGFALGMIVLIRPVNVMVLFAIPFIAGSGTSIKQAWQWFGKNIMFFLLSILVFAGIVFLQLIIYKLQTGSWIVYSYKGEGFDFLHPQILPILFSYKKGLFLYTPVYLLSLTGLYFIFKNNRFRFWSWLIFFGIILYVISSWYNWYYGGSFSGRVFIDYLPFFIIPLAFTLKYLRQSMARKAFFIVLFSLIIVCQLQTYQYRRGQIHWSDQTKEKYWHNFLGIQKLKKMF